LVRVFDEAIWEETVGWIEDGECTPFIGAGASADYVPLAGSLAADLADEIGYPFPDAENLARVTQFAAVGRDNPLYVKRRFVRSMFANPRTPDYHARDEPYGLLAELPLPIYITTNYDDFIFNALDKQKRSPIRAICPWYTTDAETIEEENSPFQEDAGYDPKDRRPIVYHLHGHHSKLQSMVLTEDDYIEFLVRVSSDPKLLPPVIRGALASNMLLFVGYGLADWTFRVIFGGLLSTQPPSARQRHVSVQLPPKRAEDPEDDRPLRIQEYLDKYFDQQHISICWETARDFTADLRQRWEAR
jgi:hypothetical protein